MRPAPTLFLAAAFAAVVCGACSLFAAEPQAPVFRALDGSSHALSELRGHPAVVNFWATWCGPCKEEMPRLQKLFESYRERGVQFVAISLDDAASQGRIPQVTGKRNFRIPVWTGADETTLRALGMGEMVPATMILDEGGQVIGRIEGEASEKDVRSRVDWLLQGRVGKAPTPLKKNDW